MLVEEELLEDPLLDDDLEISAVLEDVELVELLDELDALALDELEVLTLDGLDELLDDRESRAVLVELLELVEAELLDEVDEELVDEDDRESWAVLVEDSELLDEVDTELDDDRDNSAVLVLDDEVDEELFDDDELDELFVELLEVCDWLDAVWVEAEEWVEVLDELMLLVDADATTVLDELDAEMVEAD